MRRWLVVVFLVAASALPLSASAFVTTPRFENMSQFIDQGLTVGQVDALERAFVKFRPHARYVTMFSDLTPGPHSDTSRFFTSTFELNVDTTFYKAKIRYAGLNDIRLYLYGGKPRHLVFDSGTMQAPGR